MNVGVTSALLGTAKYNTLVGSAGCLKAIRLLDGNQVLDSIQDVNRWIAFTNYTKNNTVCSNLNNTLSQNALGFVYDMPNIVLPDEGGIDPESQFSKIEPFKSSGDIRHLEEETSSGYISLRDLFPLLNAVVNLNTAMFKNLRLVIEWSKSPSDFAVDLNEAEGLTHKFTTLLPLLCVDELTGDSPLKKSLMSKMDTISYVTLEQDRVIAQAVDATERKSQTFQIQGFNSKKVNRVCVQKVRVASSAFVSTLSSNMGSPALIEESHQWRINGSNLYPYAISSANEHLALQNDVWGVSDQPLGGCPFIGVKTLVDEVAVNELVEHFPDAEALLGETSYICANFHGRTIKELQLTYSRLGLVN